MKNFKKILLVAVALFVNDSFGMMMSSVRRYLVPMVTYTLWNKHYSMQIIFARRNFSNVRSIKDVTKDTEKILTEILGSDFVKFQTNKVQKELTDSKIIKSSTELTTNKNKNVAFFNEVNIPLLDMRDSLIKNFARGNAEIKEHVDLHFNLKATKKYMEKKAKKKNDNTKIIKDVFYGDISSVNVKSMFAAQSSEKMALICNLSEKVFIKHLELSKDKSEEQTKVVDTAIVIFGKNTSNEHILKTIFGSTKYFNDL